ncbi:MAG: hypothetical protein LBH30_08010 [Prevotellaceae bacterium]|nr:hypothetical protein [Prevotellaceae bacterium]
MRALNAEATETERHCKPSSPKQQQQYRHCERSEATEAQRSSALANPLILWIASSFATLTPRNDGLFHPCGFVMTYKHSLCSI